MSSLDDLHAGAQAIGEKERQIGTAEEELDKLRIELRGLWLKERKTQAEIRMALRSQIRLGS